MHGLAILRFRSPLLTESQCCFLFLRVLRCFTSPRSPPPAIHSPAGNTTSLVLGYPIRTSSDPRSVDNSPRHIAASHVLHRLPVPRHPPCALRHLQHTQQFSEETIAKNRKTPHQWSFPARCSQPLSTTQTPHPTTKTGRQHGVLSQDPTVCSAAR
jgi:hypothetical protein